MKSLCVAVNIYEQKVIQKEVLDKIVFIESLFVCNCKTLNLESSHLSDKIGIVAA